MCLVFILSRTGVAAVPFWGMEKGLCRTPGHCYNSCGVFLISPTFGVASVALTGLALGRIDIASMPWDQEMQLEVVISESRKGISCWCHRKPFLGCWSFNSFPVLIIQLALGIPVVCGELF